MSRASSSLDLSEFFNNDESDGHRLAEFLQKRRGVVQSQKFLFMNCEPERMSLNVQLEKITPTEQKTNSEKETCDEMQANASQDRQIFSVEEQLALMHGIDLDTSPSCSKQTNVDNKKSPEETIEKKLPVSLIANIRPNSPLSNISPSRPPVPSSPSSPVSPRFSSVRKSAGVSPGDRLRRYSLKRLTKLSGKRTLLKEFESTVSEDNFDPPVCSTPLSQPQPDKNPLPSSSEALGNQVENEFEFTEAEKNPSSNESCCGHTDTLIRTLKKKDEELRHYMESMLENTLKQMQCQEKENSICKSHAQNTKAVSLQATKSPLKRTYTVEKGSTPGQVILTPENVMREGVSDVKLLKSITEPSPSKILKTPERRVNRSMISLKVKSPQNTNKSISHIESRPHNGTKNQISLRSSKMLEISRSDTSQKEKDITSHNRKAQPINVPSSPLSNSISIIFPTQDVEIPETQEIPSERDHSIIIQSSDKQIPLVVIPVNHTYNNTISEEHLNNNTLITAKAKPTRNKTNVINESQQNQQAATVTNDHQNDQQAEDNLKLTDILTDDEDETPKAAVSHNVENNSQAPLNLAPSATNIRTKRLRKRSVSRRRLQMDNSELVSTEAETEPPQAYNTRRQAKKRHIPLNKAPGTPLNGEKFAQELARMSNYEILDLRKRNSMGRVFAISGRKSARSQNDVIQKQHELENQIEEELFKRNIDENSIRRNSRNNQASAEEDLDQYLPAPDEFRDSLVKQQQNDVRESSLIDEKSTDRISFNNKRKSSKQQKRPSTANNERMPDVLKQYLEVSKMLSKKKKRKNILNHTKRSLYTQGQSDSEEPQSSPDKPISDRRSSSGNKRQSIPCVPSPPTTEANQITTVNIVSPPPPFQITPRKSLAQAELSNEVDDEQVSYKNTTGKENRMQLSITPPPPPPGFESDSGVSSNNFNIHSTANTTLQRPISLNNTQSNNTNSHNSDDHIFKKPQNPAPKRGRKPKIKKTLLDVPRQADNGSDSEQSADNNTETTVDSNSLRRSKRGQVPLKQPLPILQLLFQQTYNKRLQMIDKNKQKQKQRDISKASRSTDNASIQSVNSKKSTKNIKRIELETVPEDDVIAALQEDAEVLLNTKKKANNIKESKVKRKQNKNSKKEPMQQNENFECSHIKLITPPPVEHLNNVFDQLRNTSSMLNASPSHQSPLPPVTSREIVKNIKPLKVRVARLKSSVQPSVRSDSRNISTTSSTSTTIGNNNSNYELISWLKNITESDSSVARNEGIFKEMRISAAANLSFTELQGVEYAFYDTDEKASLGYLRFKPRQIKTKKKAKRFHLHFVTLVGNFRITANDKESRVGVGDMVAIEKSVYYDIENLTDDIGILMVIKK